VTSVHIVCRKPEQSGNPLCTPLPSIADVLVIVNGHVLDNVTSVRFEASGNEPARAVIEFVNVTAEIETVRTP